VGAPTGDAVGAGPNLACSQAICSLENDVEGSIESEGEKTQLETKPQLQSPVETKTKTRQYTRAASFLSYPDAADSRAVLMRMP